MRNRTLLPAIVLLWSTAATAAPTISLIWTNTTGTGTTGRDFIEAAPGDTLRLLITVHADVNGLSFASVSLSWDAGEYLGLDAVECPSPENAFGPGACTDGGVAAPPVFSPFAPGVVIGPDSASSFDAGGTPPVFTTSIIVGAIELVVGSAVTFGPISIDYSLAPGFDSVNDGLGNVFYPAGDAFLGPEPGTAALLSLGLIAIGIARRPHR